MTYSLMKICLDSIGGGDKSICESWDIVEYYSMFATELILRMIQNGPYFYYAHLLKGNVIQDILLVCC